MVENDNNNKNKQVQIQASRRSFWHKLKPINGASSSLPMIDNLRGLAVLMVMVYHWLEFMDSSQQTATPTLQFLARSRSFWVVGNGGVNLFFVTSGFLLFLPYSRALLGLQAFPLTQKFYLRRALRILPAYWAALFLIVWFLPQEPSGGVILAPTQLLKSVFLHFFMLHNFQFGYLFSINGVFWTMAVESQFYLVLPLVARLAYNLGQKRRYRTLGLLTILIYVATPVAFGTLLWFADINLSSLNGYLTILYLIGFFNVFLIGMVCSFFYVAKTQAGWQLKWWLFGEAALHKIALAVAIVVLLLTVRLDKWLPGFWDRPDPIHWFVGNPLLGIGCGALLVYVLTRKASHFRFMSPLNQSLSFIGLISYSLYIWNKIIYRVFIGPFAQSFGSDAIAFMLGSILTIVLLVPFCYIFYLLFERPFTQLRRAQH